MTDPRPAPGQLPTATPHDGLRPTHPARPANHPPDASAPAPSAPPGGTP
ncbi:hypothetical protein ACFYO9_22275 [Streptomyces sp. NPDC005863]